jgi:hypothetical protein
VRGSSTNRRRALLLVLVILATASSDVLASRFSLGAMACCIKAHHQCAGVRTADDCCQRMGHGIGATVTRLPAARASVSEPILAIVPALTIPAQISTPLITLAAPTFKRPHDPPHLHPVALLI